jgi:formylmethanofuran dehydrogenase subunit E
VKKQPGKYPPDFLRCVDFHGHVCPGLAIGYAAVKAGSPMLKLGASPDEEVVAIVENDSCAVDAVQVLLGCTFGKGNLVFRDWGKQVFTFFDRATGRAVRASFTGAIPGRDERHALKQRIDAGDATEQEKRRFDELRELAVTALVDSDPRTFFEVREVEVIVPPLARIVTASPCERCGELTMDSRLVPKGGHLICSGCAAESDREQP